MSKFCELTKNIKHIGEVSTGRVDGSPTGAVINVSTNENTGETRDTLTGKLKKFDNQLLDQQGIFNEQLSEQKDDFDDAKDAWNAQINSQYIYKNGGLWADAPAQITNTEKLTYWVFTDGNGYAVKGSVTLPIAKPESPVNDDNWFVATSINQVKRQVNNLHTKRDAIEWRSGLRVTDELQLYVKDGVEYLPDSKAVPFTTGSSFESDQWVQGSIVTASVGAYIATSSNQPVSAFAKQNTNLTINNKTAVTSSPVDSMIFDLDYSCRGDSATLANDETSRLNHLINLLKSKPVGLDGEYTGDALAVGFGGLLISDALDMGHNAGISVKGLGKTKSNIFMSKESVSNSIFELTGSNNSRNEFRGLRLTTVGGSEGYISKTVSAFLSGGGANQIDIASNWVNNLMCMYKGVASDSSIRNNTAEYCMQFMDIDGGGSRDLDVSENVIYNCGNIGGGASPSKPIFNFKDIENLTLARNRVINDAPASPMPEGVYKLTNVNNFDISDQKFNSTSKYVGSYYVINGGYGRLFNCHIPSSTEASIDARNCSYLEVDKITTSSEKTPQDAFGVSLIDIEDVKIGTLSISASGLSNLSLTRCKQVTIDTLILGGSTLISSGYDAALRIYGCGNVVIDKVIFKNRSAGGFDIVVDADTELLHINTVVGTDSTRISNHAKSGAITTIYS